MQFEFDEKKSISNQEKHGVDFIEAQQLWEDPDYLEVPVKNIDEPRMLVIGKMKGKIWAGFITYRKNVVRIISVRRARKEEVTLYES